MKKLKPFLIGAIVALVILFLSDFAADELYFTLTLLLYSIPAFAVPAVLILIIVLACIGFSLKRKCEADLQQLPSEDPDLLLKLSKRLRKISILWRCGDICAYLAMCLSVCGAYLAVILVPLAFIAICISRFVGRKLIPFENQAQQQLLPPRDEPADMTRWPFDLTEIQQQRYAESAFLTINGFHRLCVYVIIGAVAMSFFVDAAVSISALITVGILWLSFHIMLYKNRNRIEK